MKLTVIYAFPHNVIEWSTPSSIYEEFKSRGWEIELINIKDEHGNLTDKYLKQFTESDSTPDIVLFMDWGQFDSIYLDKKYKPNSFWIQESGDDPQRFFINHTLSHKFHLTITPDYQSYLQYKQLGRDTEWITHFAHERNLFITIETEGSHFVPTDYPIGLISLSPKFANSVPVLGVATPQGKVTDQKMIDQHNKFRMNYKAMAQMIAYHNSFHLKPVIDKDLSIIPEYEEFMDRLEQDL